MPKTPLGTLDDAHLRPLALTPLDSSRYGTMGGGGGGGGNGHSPTVGGKEDGAAYSDVVAADHREGRQLQDGRPANSASSGAQASSSNANPQKNQETTGQQQQQQQQQQTTTNNIYLPQLDGTSSAGSSKDEDDQHHQQQHNKNQTDATTDTDDKTGASSSNETNSSKNNDNDTGKQNKSQKKKKDTSPNLKRRKLSYDPSADQANDEGAGGSGNGGYRKPPIAPKPLPLGHMRHLSASASVNGTGAAGGAAGSLRSVSMTDAESRIVNDADGGGGGADSASSQPKEGGGASADAGTGTGAGGMAASRSPNGIRRSPSAAKVNRLGSPSGSPPPKVAALLRPKFDTPNGSTSSSSANNNNNNNNNSATANASPSTNANSSSNVAAAGAHQQQDQDQQRRQEDRHRPISPSPHGTKGKRGKHVITPSGEGNSDSESSAAAVLASQVQAISKRKEPKDASKNDQGANAGSADESAASDASAEDQKKRVQTPTNELLAQQTDGTAGHDGGAHSAPPNHPPFSPWTSYLAKDRTAAPPAGLATPRGDNLRTPRVFDFSGLTPRGQYRDEGSVTFARNLAAINSPGPQAAHHRRNDSFGSGLFPNAALSPFHAGTPKDHRSIHRMGSQDSACPSESEAFQSLLHASDALFGTTADPRHAGEGGSSLNSLSGSVGSKRRGRPRKDSTASATATAKKRKTKANRKYALPTGNVAKKGPHASGSARRSRSSRGIGAPGLNPQASPRSLLMDSRGGSRSLADDLRHSPTGPPSVRRTFHDGEYEGQIVGDGRRHGYGVMHFVDGDKYAGWWNDDVMDGMGRMEYSDG